LADGYDEWPEANRRPGEARFEVPPAVGVTNHFGMNRWGFERRFKPLPRIQGKHAPDGCAVPCRFVGNLRFFAGDDPATP
jgi:hypothetical protein